VSVEGHSYVVFTYVGISLWGSFNYVFNRTSNCLLANRELLTHAYFPRLAVPFASVLATQVDVLISWLILIVFLVADGTHPTAALALIPVWFVLVQVMAASLGLLIASWTLAFRDLQSITTTVLAMGPIFIPVAYPADALPDKARFLATLNPLTPLFDAMRASTLGLEWPSAGGFAFAIGSTALLALVALRVFAQAERRLADVI
jgi:lipopolysaccharide transport system permease protein